MDKERRQDQLALDDQKTKSDEAELVKNIDEFILKQKQQKKPQHSNVCLKQKSQKLNSKIKQLKKVNQDLSQQRKRITNSKLINTNSLKNSKFVQNAQKVDSIAKISAMLSQKSVERVQLQVVIQKNEGQNDEVVQKKKRIDIQLSQLKKQKNSQRQIVEQLKNNLNSLIKSQLTKQQQFTNYLKIAEKHEKNKKQLMMNCKHDSCELNLHQFITQNNFKNQEQQSQENDEAYLEKMQEEHLKIERRKKKKKNKKKKIQKISQNTKQSDQKYQNNVNVQEQKNMEMNPEYIIGKNFQSIKIDQQSRTKCYEISDEILLRMQMRQKDIFERLTRSEVTINKNKGKNKKQKAS